MHLLHVFRQVARGGRCVGHDRLADECHDVDLAKVGAPIHFQLRYRHDQDVAGEDGGHRREVRAAAGLREHEQLPRRELAAEAGREALRRDHVRHRLRGHRRHLRGLRVLGLLPADENPTGERSQAHSVGRVQHQREDGCEVQGGPREVHQGDLPFGPSGDKCDGLSEGTYHGHVGRQGVEPSCRSVEPVRPLYGEPRPVSFHRARGIQAGPRALEQGPHVERSIWCRGRRLLSQDLPRPPLVDGHHQGHYQPRYRAHLRAGRASGPDEPVIVNHVSPKPLRVLEAPGSRPFGPLSGHELSSLCWPFGDTPPVSSVVLISESEELTGQLQYSVFTI
mmetsp:Transcript_38113/g.122529  ORF Transcript_38113/g.122529 Transcript_38113/m.122529 type:complete len:336 (-) Transcript_38113:420-1427(-)